jgi:L-alanine-DL-glutamate epimerase-like enolase superfamily enzyme
MSTYDLVADLPLRVDGYALEGLQQEVSSDFTRHSTVIHLHGGGEEGVGEDVTYDSVDHEAAHEANGRLPLAGTWTLRSFAEHLRHLELFPRPPQEQVSRLYRNWAYESAALDLALRQAGEPLHAVLGRDPQPLSFVVSLRLGDPPSLERLTSRLEDYPTLRFKLDPTSDWDDELVAGVAETAAVEVIDFKGHYDGSMMEQSADLGLYQRVVGAFGDAHVWFEDPDMTPEIDDLLAPHRSRVTWDADIHSADDIAALPFTPRMVNFKPSRIGSLEKLLDAYDYAAANGIGVYGGGMFELGPGRGQAQYMASMFHPDAPNDTSPGGFHVADPPPGLPDGPLTPAPARTGFRWTS